ncbi:MAG: guanylate kinase [Planctomycetales bacterium 4484_113]|mgnify:CR=1 FL=1|nr:MAG: guanylate kinase [Planctomycetales bacterium 4484_113]
MINGIVISGCSGVGKTTVIKHLLRLHPDFAFSVSYTTRPPRADEVDGKDYHFISREEFERKARERFFLEWEEVYGCYYGTPKLPPDEEEGTTRVVIFELDSKGALNLQQKFPQFTTIAIIPPSVDAIGARLRARGSETDESIAERRRHIAEELRRLQHLSYCVVNDDIEATAREIETIILAQFHRLPFLGAKIDELLELLA